MSADGRDLSEITPFRPVVVDDVMTSPAITVGPAATVQEVAQTLIAHDIHSVPVVEAGRRLVGVISEADLISREGYPSGRSHRLADAVEEARAEHRHHWSARAEGVTAEQVMSRDVVTCEADELAAVAAKRMLRKDVHALPVIEDGRVAGVVSRHDLLRLLDRPDREIRERIAQVLGDPRWAPDEHQVEADVADGVVVLTGTVQYPSDSAVVSSFIGQIPGVVAVTNHLKARQPEPQVPYLKDTDFR